MINNKDNNFTVSKIEINDETLEPSIIQLDDNELNNEIAKLNTKEEPKVIDAFDTKHAKQVVMNKVFGIPDDNYINHRQKVFKKTISIIFIIFVVGVLAYTFYNDFFNAGPDKKIASWSEIRKTLLSNWFYFIFAVISFILTLVFKGLKLSVLSKTLTKKINFRICFETGIIGSYYNSVTPLAVGGQPFEIYHLTKNGIHGGVAASMPIVAFFLNQVAFVILSIVSLLFLSYNTFEFTETIPVVIITMSIIGLILCMFVPTMVISFSMMPRFCGNSIKRIIKLGGKFRIIKNPQKTTYTTMKSIMHNSKCIKKIATSPLGFTISFLLSFCEQLANASIAYFTLRFFGFNLLENGFIEWLFVCQLCFILYSAISFIPTPGNSGAADISFYTLFSAGIKVAGEAFPALMVWRLLSFYLIIVIGFTFIKIKKKKESKHLPTN